MDRVWIIEKHTGEPPEPQQIGYINVIPECIRPKEIWTKPIFASFPDTLNKFNTGLQMSPIPGMSLCVP